MPASTRARRHFLICRRLWQPVMWHQPFTVVYEELAVAYEATALKILQYLHIPIDENLMFAGRRMKQQADTLSEEWVRRYHILKREREGG